MAISPLCNNYCSNSSISDEGEAVQHLNPMICSKSNSNMFPIPKLPPLEPMDRYWNQYSLIQNAPMSPPITTKTTQIPHYELPDWFKQDLETIKNSTGSELISHRHHHSNINILINV